MISFAEMTTSMLLPFTTALLLFCNVSWSQFWTSVKVEEMEWSKDCDPLVTCIQPKVQLRLLNIFNNETMSKSVNMNFDKQQVTFLKLSQ